MAQRGSELAARVAGGDRRALARAVTLVESTRAEDRAHAEALLTDLRRRGQNALRIGLTGTPGVGKSTFVEALGLRLTGMGKRLAVLAVDPSSARGGGAILGDKTRMPDLSRDPNAFIRPSPGGAGSGGVASRTRAVIDLCAGAGFDLVLVETIGVGQSETLVAEMTDLFVLLLAPAGGDELQGVKRGIMEMADLVLVNKADGDLAAAATRTTADYAGALRLLRRPAHMPDGYPKALKVSAHTGAGLDAAWAAMEEVLSWRAANGHLAAIRRGQATRWFRSAVDAALLAHLRQDPGIAARMATLEAEVAAGTKGPDTAAAELAQAAFSR